MCQGANGLSGKQAWEMTEQGTYGSTDTGQGQGEPRKGVNLVQLPNSPQAWEPNQALEDRTSTGRGGPQEMRASKAKVEEGTEGAKK